MSEELENNANAEPIVTNGVELMPRERGRYSKKEKALKEKLARIKEAMPEGDHRLKLPVKEIEGLKLRWVKDEANRLEVFLSKGWMFIGKDKAQPINESTREDIDKASHIVLGTKEDGSPLHGYLMGIEEEIYDYFYQVKQTENDRIMEDIQRNLPKANGGSESNEDGYLKQAEISVTTK